jgi:hypothetical protein
MEEKNTMLRAFNPAERDEIPATLFGVIPGERGDGITNKTSPLPRYLPSRNRGVYFGHGIPVGEINATFVFSSLCLCASSPDSPEVGTGGESYSSRGRRYYLVAGVIVKVDFLS